jgi:integrase
LGFTPFPAKVSILGGYFAQYGDRPGWAASQLMTAFSAISWAHDVLGLKNPCRFRTIRLIIDGVNRTAARPTTSKKPIQAQLMKKLLNYLLFADGEPSLFQWRSAAYLTISYFGFLRASEALALSYGDIVFETDYISVFIGKSKTDQQRKGRTVLIPNTSGDYNPYEIIRNYCLKLGLFWTSDKSYKIQTVSAPCLCATKFISATA